MTDTGKPQDSPGSEATTGDHGRVSADRSSPAPHGLIRVKLVRSIIGSSRDQRAVIAGLGLRRLNQVVVRKDTPEVRGMVAKVPHLVQIVS